MIHVQRPTCGGRRCSRLSIISLISKGLGYLIFFAERDHLDLSRSAEGLLHAPSLMPRSAVIKQLAKVIDDFGIGENAEVIQSKLTREATLPTGPFDLVFVDAPYDLRVCSTIMDMVADQSVLSSGALLVLEHGLSEFVMPSDGYDKGLEQGEGRHSR